MQSVFVEKPYQFVPRLKSSWQQRLLLMTGWLNRVIRKREGVEAYECRNLDRLQQTIAAGHSVLLTPNHPRTADPLAMYFVAQELRQPFYTMASWHLFNMGWLSRRVLRYMGGFSVNREGLDRQAVDEAIEILQHAERPLLIFPEGTTSRTNDQLMSLMEGPAFIARTAAKRRQKMNGGKVITHPVAIKYFFHGDIERACDDVLTDIEKRLSWREQKNLPLIERLIKVGDAMLTLKELQYDVKPESGLSLRDRQTRLVNQLLVPLEQEWLDGPQREDGIQIRIKNLRMKIFPEMSKSQLEPEETRRRWRQIEDTYLAQQVDCYPERYVRDHPSVDRVLEMVEKFEEDLTDQARLHGHLKAVIEIGEPIEVSPQRVRGAQEDPLITQIRDSIQHMLSGLQQESPLLPRVSRRRR